MWIHIDRTQEPSIIRQIYSQFRDKILLNELKSGERIPSTRELSKLLSISRNVVLEAYELLELEGFIITKPQIGTFVAEDVNLSMHSTHEKIGDIDDSSHDAPTNSIDLRSGLPALDLLPIKKWNKYHNEITLDSPSYYFGYGNANGTFQLRSSICHYLLRMRGLSCRPEQLIITSGSLHGFSILSQLLTQKNKQYIIEDPLHAEFKQTLTYASSKCHYIPVDNFGMQTNLLPKDIDPSYIFVTPSHQYPLGGTLPIQRRIELIEYAREKNCYIIEDDYDSEYRYAGEPVSTLFSLDVSRVIYVGTFSKVLFPSIRIGYMIIPDSLMKNAMHFVRYHDYFTNTIDQLSLSKMLDDRVVDRHISKMKKLYKIRHDFTLKMLTEIFGDDISIHGSETGLHFIVDFKHLTFTDAVIEQYRELGLLLHPVWHHAHNADYPKNSLIIGYSHLDEASIRNAIKLLSTSFC